MMDITAHYNRDDFLGFLKNNFLPDDFETAEEKITRERASAYIKNAIKLGFCPSLDLSVYEFQHESVNDPRVTLSRESFKIIETNDTVSNALAIFYNKDSANWRFSLITSEYGLGKNTKQVKRGFSNPRRLSWLLGKDCKRHTPEAMLFARGKVASIEDLSARFAIDVVTKKFYQELFDWYDTRAVEAVKFPVGKGDAAGLPPEPDADSNRQHLIRLITRLIFVWFIKQKNLVPEWIFNENKIAEVLKAFDPESDKQGTYYNGIIQNLFFATLNKAIKERCFAKKDEEERKEDYGIKTLYRDHDDSQLFKISPEEFMQKFETVPFLNGGLFECLDKFITKEYIDGFSRESKRAAFVPNSLFFGDGEKEGIIGLFNRYNFTVEENTPQDIDIALDPELLGKVFENLLGTYNEETKSTARNESGSFYTPREIVDYMADTSLKEYFKGKLSTDYTDEHRLKEDDIDKKLDFLFSYHESGHDFDAGQVKTLMDAINSCKILDPACGSGAFPMGVLNKLIFVLEKLDPENSQWKEIQIKKAVADTEEAYRTGDETERKERLRKIQEVFEQSTGQYGNYGRKLFLIENCIFGIDIQPIAIQISKLRFFISLIVDQKTGGKKENNYNVLPLPNLETKFVAANTLIGVQRELQSDLTDTKTDIVTIQKELLTIRHKHFSARKADEKIKLRKEDEEKCNELLPLLVEDGFYNPKDAELMANWNPYDQTAPADFFDAYWMFGVKDGFDVVIGNPPYAQVKKGIFTVEQFPYSEGKDTGKQNLYKVFVEGAYNLAKNQSGAVCLIVQSSLMCDLSSTYTRELLLSKTEVDKIIEFPKKASTQEGQVFKSVLQGTCICIFKKYAHSDNYFNVSINNDITTLDDIQFEKIQQSKLLKFKKINGFAIPMVKPGEFAVFEKMIKNSTPFYELIDSIYKGDLNLGTNANTFSKTKTQTKLFRGKNIQRYYLIEEVDDYLKPAFFIEKINQNKNNKMLVCQEITGTVDPRRLIFTLVSKNESFVFGDTVQKIILKKQDNSEVFLSILNSRLMDWFFRKTSTNNHIGGYEIKQFPIPKINDGISTRLNTIARKILAAKAADPQADTSAPEREIDALIYRLYDLTEEEIAAVEGKN